MAPFRPGITMTLPMPPPDPNARIILLDEKRTLFI